MQTISLIEDFTASPGPREGLNSGSEFRDRFLLPILEGNEKHIVDLDGAYGYPPSFLDEAFGRIILKLREKGISTDKYFDLIKIKITESDTAKKRIIHSLKLQGIQDEGKLTGIFDWEEFNE